MQEGTEKLFIMLILPIYLTPDREEIYVRINIYYTAPLTTLLFGIFLSASFLGMKRNIKNGGILSVFSIVVSAVYIPINYYFGASVMTKVYPLVIHLPLMLLLTFAFKKKAVLSVLSVVTAYLCCQISKWIGLVALDIFEKMENRYQAPDKKSVKFDSMEWRNLS